MNDGGAVPAGFEWYEVSEKARFLVPVGTMRRLEAERRRALLLAA